MKRILFLLSALALASCINEKEHQPESQGGKFAFTAGFSDEVPADNMTKVFLDHNYFYETLFVLWEKGDQVSVYDGNNSRKFVSDRTGLSTSLNLDSGSFDEKAEKYYALYPYDADADFSQEDGIQYVSTTLPAVQIARRDAFSSHVAIAGCTQNDKNFVFRNVTAVFKANITTTLVRSLVFQGKNNEDVAGDIKVSYADASYTVTGNGSKTVTIKPEGDANATFEPGLYYFTVLPQTFASGFTITINMSDGESIVRDVTGTNINVPRSSLSIGRAIGTEGSGTQNAPYLIKNKYDLEGLATIVGDDNIDESATTYISIVADIDAEGIVNWRPVNNIRHVDHISKLFVDGTKTVDDGKVVETYKISNFAPTNIAPGEQVSGDQDTGHDQPSIFGIIRGTVQNLTVENASLNTTSSNVGILAGWIGFEGLETSYVKNVSVSGSVSGNKAVGGLAGMVRNADIRNCSSNVTVNAAGEHASGLIARYYENLVLRACHSSGSIKGTRGVGGILGFNEKTSSTQIDISECSSTCAIEANYQVGGLVGHTKSNILIDSSWVVAPITATSREKNGKLNPGKQVGGILGVADGTTATLRQNYYKGNISADGSFVGGMMGYAKGGANITNCHVCCNIENTGAYYSSHKKNYDMIGVGGVLGCVSGTYMNIASCFVEGDRITGKAHGTLTEALIPATWDAWIEAVTSINRDYYLGGGIGGIVGVAAPVTPANNAIVGSNICYVKEISCTRTSIYDAPCAPIIGCISSEAAYANYGKNRHYQSPEKVPMTFSDGVSGYQPRTLAQINSNALRDNIINAIDDGTNLHQFCMYCRPLSNDGVGGVANAPCSTITSVSWGGWNKAWNCEGFKPYLIHIERYGAYDID